MLRNKTFLIVSLLLTSFYSSLYSQNNTDSPYSRYGYGNLTNPVNGMSRAMGGTSYGMRGNLQPNFMNPASYSAVDSMTFIFDMAVSGYVGKFSEANYKETYTNGNIDYITMQFPISKKIGVSMGLVPYSFVGYNYSTIDTVHAKVVNNYIGTGGLSQVYIGGSINLFKGFSAGVNASYIFGAIDHTYTPIFSDYNVNAYGWAEMTRVQDFKFDVGLQYTTEMRDYKQLTIGAVFSPKMNLNTTSRLVRNIEGGKYDTVWTKDKGYQLPLNIGLGVNYKWNRKYTIAADVQYQNWASTQFADVANQFNNSYRGSVGFEYIPNLQDRAFFNKVRYRAGLNFNQSPIKVNGNKVQELGMSVGLGLPLRSGKSMVNLSFEYTSRNAPGTNYVKENYYKLTLNMNVNEFWFFKQKL